MLVELQLVGEFEVAALPAVQPAAASAPQCGVDQPIDDAIPELGGVGVFLVVDERGAVDQLVAQPEHRGPEHLVLPGVVAIQRGRCHADPRGDLLHADAVVPQFAERLSGDAGDLLLAVLRTSARWSADLG